MEIQGFAFAIGCVFFEETSKKLNKMIEDIEEA